MGGAERDADGGRSAVWDWLVLASRDVREEREGTDGAGRGCAALGGH